MRLWNLLSTNWIAILLVTLTACSDGEPLNVSEKNPNAVGVWQQRIERQTTQSLSINNTLLILNANGDAQYRRCVYRSELKSGRHSRFRTSIDLGESIVTQITDKEITLLTKLGWFGFNTRLKTTKAPYQINDQWHWDINGNTLDKLDPKIATEQSHWTCPDEENNGSMFESKQGHSI